MNQSTQQKQNKKSSGAGWGLLILLIPLLMRVKDGDLPPVVFFAIAVIVVVAVLVSLAKKKGAPAAKTGSASTAAPTARKTPTVELHRPAPAMQRREAPLSSSNHFPKPDAYCVTCENTGEDHFVRDRKRRIEQLDEWLKNGLIDRQEYLVLKARFEKDQ